jgi:glycosyltransferase involved in cell wall biosynthesis
MITVTVLTKNSLETVGATLDALRSFPEVLLYDTGSTDTTLALAATYPNVRIVQGPLVGFGPTHNAASTLATHDWILSIDSDEVLSDALVRELHGLVLNEAEVYQIDRHNYFNGKWIKYCGGWYPDPVIRLYNRTKTAFTEDAVHERVKTQGLRVVPLSAPMRHTPYRRIDDLLTKMQLYSTLFAQQNRGKQVTLATALLHAGAAFCKSYFFKRGFLGGAEGLILSLYNGHTTLYKYLKVRTLRDH